MADSLGSDYPCAKQHRIPFLMIIAINPLWSLLLLGPVFMGHNYKFIGSTLKDCQGQIGS